MADVFISYSRSDRELVRALHEALVQDDRDSWVDWEDIPLTAEWLAEIYTGIEAADTFIFILSPDSIRSDVCGRELAHALEHNKRLVPVVARDVDTDRVPEPLAARNWVFFRPGDDFATAYRSLVQALDTDLDWMRSHTRLLTRAIEWDNRGRDASFVLRGSDLRSAEEWLSRVSAEKEPAPTALQTQYILASRRAASAQQRNRFAAVSVALVVAIGLAVLAWFQREAAVVAQIQAEEQRQVADEQRQVADEQREVADVRRQEAEQQRRLAEQQAAVALSRQLAVRAQQARSENNLDLALLLPVQAMAISPTDEARSNVLGGLLHSPRFLATLRGHRDDTVSVAFSPDGKMLASGGSDKQLRLWDVAAQQPLGEPIELAAAPTSLLFGPDGRLVIALGGDVLLWDPVARQAVGDPLPGSIDAVTSLALGGDGNLLAAGSSDGTIVLWDLASRQPLGPPIAAHTLGVFTLGFSPDSRLLASGSCATMTSKGCVDGELYVWDVAAGRRLDVPIGGHEYAVESVAFSPDGTLLASAGCRRAATALDCAEGEIRLWDPATWQPAGSPLVGHAAAVTSLAFSPDGRLLASSSRDRTAILWDAFLQQPIGRPLAGHTDAVERVAFSPDGALLATASRDATVRLWDATGEHALGAPVAHEQIGALAFGPVGQMLASGGCQQDGSPSACRGDVRLWDLATRHLLGPPLSAPGPDVVALSFSPVDNLLAAGDRDGMIALWDVASRQSAGAPLAGDATPIRRLLFGPDGRVLAAENEAGVRLWDVQSRQSIGVLADAEQPVFSPDGRFLAAVRSDGVVLWDVAGGKPVGPLLAAHRDAVTTLAFSPDGALLATGGQDQSVVFWDVSSGRRLGEPLALDGPVQSLAFSPDGRVLAVADGTVTLWDLASRRPIGAPLGGHTVAVSVAFSPDGALLATGGCAVGSIPRCVEGDARLWSTSTWEQIGLPLSDAGGGWVEGLVFSPDGRWLASRHANAVSPFQVWAVAADAWTTRACRLVGRNLTQTEWVHAVGPEMPYRRTCPDLPPGDGAD